jgi:predicted nucleic acid-binding protein
MPESGTSGSVGTAGEQSPAVTRPPFWFSRSERDALIVATALRDGMTVVTRNLLDFKNLGIKLINSWGS